MLRDMICDVHHMYLHDRCIAAQNGFGDNLVVGEMIFWYGLNAAADASIACSVQSAKHKCTRIHTHNACIHTHACTHARTSHACTHTHTRCMWFLHHCNQCGYDASWPTWTAKWETCKNFNVKRKNVQHDTTMTFSHYMSISYDKHQVTAF